MALARGQADQPGAHPCCRLARQECRTAEAVITTDHQHMPEIALVGRAPARAQATRLAGPVDAPRTEDLAGVDGCRHLEGIEEHLATVFGGLAGEQTALEPDETDGRGSPYRHTQHHPTIGIQASRNVHRQYRCRMGIDRLHCRAPGPDQLAIQAGAEQGVDQEVTIAWQGPVEIRPGPLERRPVIGMQAGVTGDALALSELDHLHRQTGLGSQPRDHETVAAIVAGTAQYAPASRLRPAFARQGKGHFTGALHQLGTGDVETLDGLAVERAHLFSGVQRRWQGLGLWHHAVWHLGRVCSMNKGDDIDYAQLARHIKQWGRALGFGAVGICDTDLTEAERHLHAWLAKGYHGTMDYMQRHGSKRTRPAELVPGTLRIISVRLDYRPSEPDPGSVLRDPAAAFISRYALGRDYHKVLRARLKKLAQCIAAEIGDFGYRVFTDSAPVMEKAIAQKAGLGWVGKHSNILARDAGRHST